MIFEPVGLIGAYLIKAEPSHDARGMFARTMCRAEFAAHDLADIFVQQNISVTNRTGTVRGMHFQRAPHGEAKLVRCVRGSVFDVIVDLRPESATYLKSAGFRLDSSNRHQLYVPPGFAHGFQTLVDDVEMTYLMSAMYEPSAGDGVRYDDPLLAIEWPLDVTEISSRDAAYPLIERRVFEAS